MDSIDTKPPILFGLHISRLVGWWNNSEPEILSRLLRKALADENILTDFDEPLRKPVACLCLRNEACFIMAVTCRQAAQRIVCAEITAVGLMATASLAYFDEREGFWRDLHPVLTVIPFQERFAAALTWGDQAFRLQAAAAHLVPLLKAIKQSLDNLGGQP